MHKDYLREDTRYHHVDIEYLHEVIQYNHADIEYLYEVFDSTSRIAFAIVLQRLRSPEEVIKYIGTDAINDYKSSTFIVDIKHSKGRNPHNVYYIAIVLIVDDKNYIVSTFERILSIGNLVGLSILPLDMDKNEFLGNRLPLRIRPSDGPKYHDEAMRNLFIIKKLERIPDKKAIDGLLTRAEIYATNNHYHPTFLNVNSLRNTTSQYLISLKNDIKDSNEDDAIKQERIPELVRRAQYINRDHKIIGEKCEIYDKERMYY